METQSTYLTAILADDEISILRELENAIDWAGLGIQLVRLATNGQDALGAILEFRPDFAIIDIKMPDLDGIEVIQKTRKLGITTDFIILSGYDSFSYAKDAIRYGATIPSCMTPYTGPVWTAASRTKEITAGCTGKS